MDVGRAIAYIFEDRHWVQKLIPLLLVGVASLIPIFGLLATALGLGFMLQLACNVRDGLPRPIPKWDELGEKFRVGGYVLLAGIFYNLPLILLTACTLSVVNIGATGFLGIASTVYLACCALPLIFGYTLVAYSLLAVGVTEYIQTDRWERMYRPLHLWDVIQANRGIVLEWIVYTILVNLALAILLAIPVIGWAAVLLFGYPVQGHLFGQFAHKLGIQNQPQVKRGASRA